MCMKKGILFTLLTTLFIFIIFYFVKEKIAIAQNFQLSNFSCSNVSVNNGSHSARCDGKYTLSGTLPSNGYNIDLKLTKTYEYQGTQSDGTETKATAVSQIGQVVLTVNDLPSQQNDSDIAYHVNVSVNDHINSEYNIGSFSFTIPKKTEATNDTTPQDNPSSPTNPNTTIPDINTPTPSASSTNTQSATSSSSSSKKYTFAFGGKVLSTTIPGVICTGIGTPIILSSNIGGAISAASSQFSSSSGEKITGGVTGVYKMIPFYATNITKQPKVGGYILGKADIAPDLSICKTETDPPIPVPVRKTSNYGVSKR